MEQTCSVVIDGKPVEGAAFQIVEILSTKNRFVEYKTIKEYIEKVAQDIWRLYGIGINAIGNTIEEKCESLLNQLIAKGLLQTA
jgi:hypothetical protein